MKHSYLVLVVTLVACAAENPNDLPATEVASQNGELIYGADDRQEAFEVTNATLQTVANATVGLISTSDLSSVSGGIQINVSQSFGSAYQLCSSEPYRSQPTSMFCSGFLVGPDLVATAGHCIDTTSCGTTAFVFGFEMLNSSTVRSVVPSGDVYTCAQVVSRVETSTNDYAVIRLDRAVQGRVHLPLRRSGSVGLGAPLWVSGHPAGIPLKVAGGATVKNSSHPTYFESNLDTYGGNSGSPVVNAQGAVEGILVRGNADFVLTGKGKNRCYVSNQCNDSGCPGWEDVTRASAFTAYVPDGPQCTVNADCDDANPCNGQETCSNAMCTAGTAPDCNDSNACTADQCVALDAQNFSCQSSVQSCDDGDACTVDSCAPATGCSWAPLQCGAGEVCSDGTCVETPSCSPRWTPCSTGSDCCSGTCHHKKKTCN